MLRRNVAITSGYDNSPLRSTNNRSSGRSSNLLTSSSLSKKGREEQPFLTREKTRFLTVTFFVLAIVLTAITYAFPSQVRKAEQEAGAYTERLAQHALEVEKQFENEMSNWLGGGHDSQRHPPIPEHEHPHFQKKEAKQQASERMLQQESKWVDGEKKLKAKLKVLAQRQAEGKDLRVPVLTRYLGEDIPAWAGPGVNVEDWNARVKARYDEMRKEEEDWKRKVGAILATQRYG